MAITSSVALETTAWLLPISEAEDIEFEVKPEICICEFSVATINDAALCVLQLTTACDNKTELILLAALEVFATIFNVTLLPSVNPMFEVLGDVLLVTDTVCFGVTITDDALFAVEADIAADDLLDAEIEEVAPLVVEVICAVDFKAQERLPVAFAVLLDTDVLALLKTAIEAAVEAVEAVAETVALDDTETDDVLDAVEELTDVELLLDNEADDVA